MDNKPRDEDETEVSKDPMTEEDTASGGPAD
jgi:hypothetical protein